MNKFILSLLLCVSLNAFAAELHLLVASGTVDQVREYLKAHPEHVNHENSLEATPLFVAAKNGNVEVARLLIDSGADVNHKNSSKETPLHYAAFYGRVDVVRLLIDHGAKVNHQDSEKRTLLFYAALYGSVEVVQLLIDRGADVNHENSSKQTPLFKAALYGRVDVVQLLIDLRANVNQVDHHGITPLFEAARRCHLECVRLLLESGANIPFTVDQSEGVRRMNVPEIIQLLEGKNILTASSEVFAEFDGLIKKQLKPCVRQPNVTTCMAHALKNAGLLTEYYAAEVEERKEIDKKFTSQSVYDECFQSDAFASLRAIITGQDFTTLAGGRASEIGTAVFKISRTIDPKIQVIFDPNNFSLRQRDQSRKSEVVLVLSNKVHWHAIGMEEQSDGTVEISVLDSFYHHFCLEENFYRKLTHWFKGGSIEQPATEQLRSRL